MADEQGQVPARRGPELPARRFREEEAAVILARASSREARSDVPTPHDPTLADLMAVAAEVGLDPGEVRRAASLQERAVGSAVAGLLGGPGRREISAHLDGVSRPRVGDAVARLAEGALGHPGTVVEDSPDRWVWKSQGALHRGALSLTERDGTLSLSASTDQGGRYLAFWFGGLVVWAGLAALAPLAALPLVGQAAAFLLTPLAVAHPLRVMADRRARARLERLALDVLRLAEEETGRSLPPPSDAGG